MSTSGIMYSMVGRCPECVLAEVPVSEQAGLIDLNPSMVARKILKTIEGQQNTKMSYVYSKHFFHYMLSNGLVYLCMAEESFSRRNCFMFLADVAGRFEATFGDRGLSASPYEMSDEFYKVLQSQMQYFTKHKDPMAQVKGEVEEVKDLVSQTIEKVIDRNERIELIVDRSEELSRSSYSFRRSSTTLKRAMMCKNLQTTLTLAAVALVIIICIVVGFCGWDFHSC